MKLHYEDDQITLYHGRALEVARTLPSKSVQCIVTSPPYYGLRDYGRRGQYGTETTLRAYIRGQVTLFRELRRVLTDTGTLWLNLGDSYAGRANAGRAYDGNRGMNRPAVMPTRKNTTGDAPFKNLLMVPHKVAIALQGDGWILRNDIVWHKTNAKPESVQDRLSSTYEHLFMFSKKPRYYFDLDALRDFRRTSNLYPEDTPSRLPNPGDVWSIGVTPFRGAHFATFPPEIPSRAIMASTRPGDTVLDVCHGSGTTGMVAQQAGRRYIGVDINEEYLDLSLRTRLNQPALKIEGES